MEPLHSAKLKVQRADVHIRNLNRAIGRASRQAQISFSRKGKLKLPNSVHDLPFNVVVTGVPELVEFQIDPNIRENWGLYVGDIVGNLRAALDHIAWALSEEMALSEKQQRRVVFPLYPTQDEGNISSLSDNLKLLPLRCRDTIKKFQPYNRTHWPELNLLGILHHLSNEDKHRIVTPVLGEIGLGLANGGQIMQTRLNEPSKFQFAVFPSVSDNLKPQASLDVVVEVGFLKWPNKWFPVSQFRQMHNFIRDEVIPAFTAIFNESSKEEKIGEG